MARLVGALLLLAGAIGAAVGGIWAVLKASGAEVDICNGPRCTNGWDYAGPILVGSVAIAAIGIAVLRGSRSG